MYGKMKGAAKGAMAGAAIGGATMGRMKGMGAISDREAKRAMKPPGKADQLSAIKRLKK